MLGEVDPARDCPTCPEGHPLGTPISRETGVDRWDGPDDATLWCPMCGAGWKGSTQEYARAWRSWRAYEAECARGVA